ncbi:MAG: DUF1549 domain-containing protein [Polyangiaceae bacterium]
MRFGWGVAALLVVACGDGSGDGPPGGEAGGVAVCDGGGGAGSTTRREPDDELPPLRLLRRASLTLLGVPPTLDQLEALLAAGDRDAQLAAVDAFVDQALKDPRFYDTMFELGRHWLKIPLIDRTADAPEYGPQQQRVLTACDPGTAQAGALRYYRDDIESEAEACGSGAPTTTLEPWWAPGSQVTLTGNAANTSSQGEVKVNGSLTPIECQGRATGTCGCYVNGASCWYDPGTYPGWAAFIPGNPEGQRRLLSEEPARLFAHLVWHDRPMTDLILGDMSVGPTVVQAAHVSQSLAGGELGVVDDVSWFSPSAFAGGPVDPHHDDDDPAAWREYTISARNRFFLAERDYHFDPRTESGLSRGFPSAGMLTSLGFLNAYPRERLRAARALEALACEELLPPGGGIEFPPYVSDPGREGPCQHCHGRIDTAALHFKRYAKHGSAFEGWGARYFMPGVGDWTWDPDWQTGAYPFHVEPFAQWNKWYAPGTLLTPATDAEVAANPYARFLDFLPEEETLLGQHGDGTVGPLGFAKIVVAAGAFDRCVVRRVHQRLFGRDIDPTVEAGYLATLTSQFVDGDRQVRPFIKALTQSTYFRRGI